MPDTELTKCGTSLASFSDPRFSSQQREHNTEDNWSRKESGCSLALWSIIRPKEKEQPLPWCHHMAVKSTAICKDKDRFFLWNTAHIPASTVRQHCGFDCDCHILGRFLQWSFQGWVSPKASVQHIYCTTSSSQSKNMWIRPNMQHKAKQAKPRSTVQDYIGKNRLITSSTGKKHLEQTNTSCTWKSISKSNLVNLVN